MGVRLTIVAGPDGPMSEPLVFELDQARVVIGRGAGADVRIPHLTVSEAHASLRSEGDGYALVDQGSTNGTKVNGGALTQGRKRKLVEGDRLEIGAYVMTFQASIPVARPTTAERTAELARRLFRQWQHGGGRSGPRVVVLEGMGPGKTLSLAEPPSRALIGSAPSCQLVISGVAAEQCELTRDLDGVLVKNLDPKHALEINGRAVTERRLRDGDELRLGQIHLLFEEPADEQLQALSGERDVALPAPKPPAQEESAAAAAGATDAPQASPPPPRRTAKRASWDADMLIYALAAVVIVASALGLLALLRE